MLAPEPSAARTAGRSRSKSWSCSVLVPVDTMTLPPYSSAGTRYANVLPVPVPASATSCVREAIARAIACDISSCCERKRNPGSARDSMPPSRKMASSASSWPASSCSISGSDVASSTLVLLGRRLGFGGRLGLRRRRGRSCGVGLRGGERHAPFVDLPRELVVDLVDAILVVLRRLAFPSQVGHGIEPELLQLPQVVHGVAVSAGFAQRRLVRARDVDLLLVDAVFA